METAYRHGNVATGREARLNLRVCLIKTDLSQLTEADSWIVEQPVFYSVFSTCARASPSELANDFEAHAGQCAACTSLLQNSGAKTASSQ